MECWLGTNLCMCDCAGWGQLYVQAAFLASDATTTGRHAGCCCIAGTDNTHPPRDCWNRYHTTTTCDTTVRTDNTTTTTTWLVELTTHNHMTGGTDNTQSSHNCWNWQHTITGLLELTTHNHTTAGMDNTQPYEYWNWQHTTTNFFFSRVNFLCWLLFQYPFHPHVTAVSRVSSPLFCQKCRPVQITAQHTCTYACGFEWSDATWCTVVRCTQNVRRKGSSFR